MKYKMIFCLLVLIPFWLNSMEVNTGKPPAKEEKTSTPYRGTMTIQPDISATHPGNWDSTALNGMSHKEIAAFRMEKVELYNKLNIFPARYHPFESYHRTVFGRITPGEGWLPPASYYVANPYHLIVMVSANHVTPLNLYCTDVKIVYDDRTFKEKYSGNNAACWFEMVYGSKDYPGKIRPVMVNAWDAGFFFIHVDRKQSLNIKGSNDKNHITNCATTVASIFHFGRYKVNNISPTIPKHWLSLEKRGAETRIHVKLWRHRPASIKNPADLVYVTHVRN